MKKINFIKIVIILLTFVLLVLLYFYNDNTNWLHFKGMEETNAGEFGEQSKHFSVLKKNKYSLLIFSVS